MGDGQSRPTGAIIRPPRIPKREKVSKTVATKTQSANKGQNVRRVRARKQNAKGKHKQKDLARTE